MRSCMLLQIEKLIYGGDGLARAPQAEPGIAGKAVFVPFVLPAEQVEATAVEQRPGFVRARLDRVLQPSAQRVDPECPYFARCGGCHYQHTGYEHQLEIKRDILRETLRRVGKLEWSGEVAVHRGEPWNYRNRTRLQVRTAPQFQIAYFRHGSHELLPIERCPISGPLLNQAIESCYRIGRDGAWPAEIVEVELFCDSQNRQLLLEAYAVPSAHAPKEALEAFWTRIQTELSVLAGMTVFEKPQREPEFREARAIASFGSRELRYSLTTQETGDQSYLVSAGSFFQTNLYLTETLLSLIVGKTSGALALDLYAGVGLFACALAKEFEKVIAVEASPRSFADLRRNAPAGVKAVHDTVDHYLARAHFAASPDFVVVDPPRAGLGEKAVRALAGMSPRRLTYVSCDPATLSRDLRGLVQSGLRIERVHLVDLFPQTFHIESVVELVCAA